MTCSASPTLKQSVVPTHNGSPPSTPSSIVIVDCGSGYSRVSRFHRSSSPSTNDLIHATTTGSHIPALHLVIHCPQKSSEWLDRLTTIVAEVDTDTSYVLLGATGGVRDLVSSGGITAEDVERFRELLVTNLPFVARLVVLSGGEEAGYEFRAAEYCAGRCGFVTDGWSGSLGVLSCGGMSSQISVKGVSLCVPTEVKRGNQMGIALGMVEGKAAFYERVKKAVEREVPDNFGGANVRYVAIEMFAGVGNAAGMDGGVVVPVPDAIEKLSCLIEKKTEEDRAFGKEGDRTWRTYSHVMGGIVARLVLERLHPETEVLFVRNFELGEGHILKPSWALGCGIEKLMHEKS